MNEKSRYTQAFQEMNNGVDPTVLADIGYEVPSEYLDPTVYDATAQFTQKVTADQAKEVAIDQATQRHPATQAKAMPAKRRTVTVVRGESEAEAPRIDTEPYVPLQDSTVEIGRAGLQLVRSLDQSGK